MPDEHTCADAALLLLKNGWFVFPVHSVRKDGACTCNKTCASPAKHPVTKRGLLDASSDPQIVMGWWRRWPWANLAIATGAGSGIVVLDVDIDKGGNGSLMQLEEEVGSLSNTLTSHTGGGGVHLVYRHPGSPVKTRARAFGPGLDIRGDGGYIVAPPSRHISGHGYFWDDESVPIAPFPAVLSERLRARQVEVPSTVVPLRRRGSGGTPYGLTALQHLVEELLATTEGARNDTLNRITYRAARLVAGGELEHDPTMAEIAKAATSIGLGEPEIRATIASASTAGAGKPASAPPRDLPVRPTTQTGAIPDDGWVPPVEAPDDQPDDQPVSEEKPEPAVELDVFLSEPDPEYDWLIDGFLERGDRLILTGPEGGGKSTFLRQIAVQAGSGIHPFTLDHIDPIRVLYVDLENSRGHVRRQLRPLRLAAGNAYHGTVHIAVEASGMDLYGHPPDADWLEARIVATEAELLIIGPLYKLAAGDPTSEEVARRVSAKLDQLRTKHAFALLLEAHSPHAPSGGHRPKRPYGASMWLRWPEFGIYLAENGQLVSWRGARDERDWPLSLKRGGKWPWTPVSDPREDLFHQIVGYVEARGMASERTLAGALDVSRSRIHRAIEAHQAVWDALKSRFGEVTE